MIDIELEQINIEITPEAARQIVLIKENDFTIGEGDLRLKVDGKGCGGFEYAVGFTDAHDDDLKYCKQIEGMDIQMLIDPFTAHYCQNGKLDYLFDKFNNEDGFIFVNHNEKTYRGKFFKDESLLPGMKDGGDK